MHRSWNGLGRWADKRLPGLLLLVLLVWTMRPGEFLAAALLLVGTAYLAHASDPACGHGLACRAEVPAALALFGRVGERLLASLPR